jgi:Rad3-related DNA helicase
LLGVCRGKISEGLDFKDNIGRAVSVVGVPYLCIEDLTNKLKQKYLGEKAHSQWYYE